MSTCCRITKPAGSACRARIWCLLMGCTSTMCLSSQPTPSPPASPWLQRLALADTTLCIAHRWPLPRSKLSSLTSIPSPPPSTPPSRGAAAPSRPPSRTPTTTPIWWWMATMPSAPSPQPSTPTSGCSTWGGCSSTPPAAQTPPSSPSPPASALAPSSQAGSPTPPSSSRGRRGCGWATRPSSKRGRRSWAAPPPSGPPWGSFVR
mmetsp:Transcript_24662/g.57188  ORF Transcript_24662/g.57188 Transcript_24662/m.57188 type:complete len:205 (+) Transcript_24662:182-796(+)